MTDTNRSGQGRADELSDVVALNLVDLLVDEDNFRLEPNPDQPTALKAMLKRQGPKLVTLSESLLEGMSRGEFIWAAPDPRPDHLGKFVVCEGNRRVTALKLMNEPALADGTTWAKRFKELGQRFSEAPISKVRAVLYPSVDVARPDVYRRHTNAQNGVGLEDWGPFAQDRANKSEGLRRTHSMVVLEHLTTSSIEGLAESLGLSERTTNADRLLSTFSKQYGAQTGIKIRVSRPYGIELGDEPEFNEELLWAILRASDVSVDAIKSEGQRTGLLGRIIEETIRSSSGGPQDDEPEGQPPEDSERRRPPPTDRDPPEEQPREPGPSPRPRREPLTRKTLAPTDRSLTLRVIGPRLTGLYLECRTIDVSSRPNAAACLLRVFLELSCEAFLEHHKIRANNKSGWSAIGTSLDAKVRKVLAQLDHDEKLPELKDAWDGVSEDHSFRHSVRTLHRAMHDRHHVLDPTEIKMAWDRWHPLLAKIYASF